jgi:hypothetical protein
MTKRQLIDEIMEMNRSAEPDFLSRFEQKDLEEYYVHLQDAYTPRPLVSEAPRERENPPREIAGRSFRWAVAPERFVRDDLHHRIRRMTTQLDEILPAAVGQEEESEDAAASWDSVEDSAVGTVSAVETAPAPRLRPAIHCLDEMDEGRAGWLF